MIYGRIENKNFYKLKIENSYSFTYYDTQDGVDNYNKTNFKIFNYDETKNKIYLKYDNFFGQNAKYSH